jgi:hypothetical protein
MSGIWGLGSLDWSTRPEPGRRKEGISFLLQHQGFKRHRKSSQKADRGEMAASQVETKELPNGYAYRYRPGGVSLVELADWVESERRCCPFFDMAIETEREGGPVWLKITGRQGVKEFIRGEFKGLTVE